MMLRVDELEFSYTGDVVIHNINFSITQHDILAILGPNGVGKTTLLKCLNRILHPRQGSVLIDNQETRKLRRVELTRLMGYVPQKGESSRLTVYDLILLGRKPHLRWNADHNDHAVVASVIDLLKLDDLMLRYVDEISGGEFQMVQIARALAQQPRVMLLDEPTSNLDISNQLRIMDTLKRIVESHAMVAVMAIHDINLALRYANKFLLLRKGMVYASGGREVISAEHIYDVYGIAVSVEEINGVPLVVPV